MKVLNNKDKAASALFFVFLPIVIVVAFNFSFQKEYDKYLMILFFLGGWIYAVFDLIPLSINYDDDNIEKYKGRIANVNYSIISYKDINMIELRGHKISIIASNIKKTPKKDIVIFSIHNFEPIALEDFLCFIKSKRNDLVATIDEIINNLPKAYDKVYLF